MNQDFVRKWFHWKSMPPPVDRFRNEERNAASFDVECAVDHLASAVAALSDGFAANREWDFPMLAGKRLDDLKQIENLLDTFNLEPSSLQRITEYLSHTRALLNTIAQPRND